MPPKKENVLGIVGLICSIAGAVLLLVSLGFFWFVSLPLSVAGLICGLLGRQKVDRGELESGRGVAQAGFIVGIVGVVLHVLALVIIVVLIGLLIEAADEIEIPEHERQFDFDSSSLLLLPALLPRHRLGRGGYR